MILLDMDMPKSCAECELHNYHFCDVTKENIENYEEKRAEFCPIKAEIPTGASNGDVIKAMFPHAKTWIENHPEMQLDVMRFDLEDSETLDCFNLEWWNAPWKGQENAD